MAVQGSLFSSTVGQSDAVASPEGKSEPGELCRILRASRKPMASFELDSMPLAAELDSTASSGRRD